MNPKALNALAARVARIEALLENKDLFGPGGGATYGGLTYEGSQFGGVEQQLVENYGFGANDATVFDLQQRIAELELLVAGGSNDTRQSDPLDATQSVGDDGSDGTGGGGSGVPEGYGPVEISICDGGVAKTMTVLGTTPV